MSRFLRADYQKMAPYTPGEQPRGETLIKLNTNESPFPPAPGVMEAIDRSQIEALRLYSDPTLRDLTEAIAARHALTGAQVTAGNGSDELIAFAFMAYGAGGVRCPDITYGFYPVWARLFGLPFERVPLEDDFSIDIERYGPDDRMIVLANPNAPTGRALELSAIDALAARHPAHVVLVDEAYVEFGAQSALPLIARHDNLLIARTFSKSHALAGARIGYLMGHEALIADIEKIRYAFNPYNVGRLPLLAGAAAMRDERYYAECRQKIMDARAWTAERLGDLGFCVMPSQANFLFAARPGLGGAAYNRQLRAQGVLVRHFGLERIANYNRITIGSMADMERFIEATEKIIRAGGL